MRNLLLAMLFFGVLACKGPMPNPESVDLIYLDLVSLERKTNGELRGKEKEIEDLRKKLDELGPRDVMVKPTKRELSIRERELVDLRQKAEYYTVRKEQRLEYVKIEYPKRYAAEKPWPDREEFEAYKKVKELQEAPKSWEGRVPKNTRHLKKTK